MYNFRSILRYVNKLTFEMEYFYKLGSLNDIMKSILDLIYPVQIPCIFCRGQVSEVNDVNLCQHCLSMMPFVGDNSCSTCGRPISPESLESNCAECLSRTTYFDMGWPVFEFVGLVQSALHRLKYEGDIEIAPAIGRLMARKLKQKKWDIDIIVPVPLHSERLEERGYNQSLLLAGEIGRECGIDVKDNILLRTRCTESQVNLSRSERRLNVRNAFSVSDTNLAGGKSFLIVDDIITTGATINECSRVLKDSGALKIYYLTAACAV